MARINLGKVVPEKGIDYFTDAEVEEIKNEIKVEIDAQGMARDIELLKTDSGHSVELTLDPQTYQIVLVLKNAAGTALSTQTIDLPNENAVTNLAYNNGVLTITKQSGATSQINLTGLIEGLVTESDFNTFKEALQTTLEAINEKDAEQDEAIAENYKVINKLNEKLENQQKVIDQLPQVEGQGTSITLENTIEAQFTKFDVEGNSDQETNLFDGQLSQGTLDSTGAEVDSVYRIRTTNYIEVVGGTTIPIRAQSSKEIQYLVYVFNNSKEVIETMGWNDINTSQTLQLNAKYIKLLFCHKDGSAISTSNVTNIVVGDTPNPNYEQPIESAGDNENLFDFQSILQNKGNYYKKEYYFVFYKLDDNFKKEFTVSTLLKGNSQNLTMGFSDETFTSGGASYRILNGGITITPKTFDFSSAENVYFFIGNGSSLSSNLEEVDQLFNNYNIKLEKGNKATPYSPYGMGSINQKISNKNLCKITDFSKAVANVQIKAENNILSFNGTTNNTISANDAIWKNIKLEVKEKGVYAPSLEKSITGVAFGYYKENSSTLISPYSELEVGSYTLGIYVPANTAFNNFTTGVQIELGSTATPYVPHEEQDYSIFVQKPMRSIGDVRDLFFKNLKGSKYYNKDLEENKWYERHYISKVVLDGTEYWELQNNCFTINISDIKKTPNYGDRRQLITISNYYIAQTSEYRGQMLDLRVCKTIDPGLPRQIAIKDTSKTLAEFKAMLVEKYASGNPVYVNYLLAEPLDLPCTSEQIDVLENKPSTYKDFTIIQSEDETEAYLEVSGIYDLNKLITRTEVLESEV